jgi:hypothetical protein
MFPLLETQKWNSAKAATTLNAKTTTTQAVRVLALDVSPRAGRLRATNARGSGSSDK